MAHDWILDVLADLKTYSERNGLTALASELEEASLIAATEISSAEGKEPLSAVGDAGTTGYIY